MQPLPPAVVSILETWYDGITTYGPQVAVDPVHAKTYFEQAEALRPVLEGTWRIDMQDYETKALVITLLAMVSTWIDQHVQNSGCLVADHVIDHVNEAVANLGFTLALVSGDASLPAPPPEADTGE